MVRWLTRYIREEVEILGTPKAPCGVGASISSELRPEKSPSFVQHSYEAMQSRCVTSITQDAPDLA